MASLQRRVGPNVHGYYGVFQPFLDGVKLLTKELLIPAKANFYIFLFSPMFMMTLSFSLWAIIPLSFNFSIFDSQFSLLFFFILSSLNVYNIILAGWSSNSKYAFLGSVRAIAQFLSYELVFGFALLFMLLFIGSLRLFAVIYKQYYIGFLLYPLLPFALIFFIVLLMETNRAPFDLPEAESELVAGYNVEYSSIMFAMFFLGEYCNIISMSSIWIILFWGGFAAQTYGTLFFVIKILFFCFLFIFIRSLLPRYRLDQLIYVGWHVMLPVCVGVLFFLISLLAFTQSAALTLIYSLYRPILTWRGFGRLFMGSKELHWNFPKRSLDSRILGEVLNEYHYGIIKWIARGNEYTHFLRDERVREAFEAGEITLQGFKNTIRDWTEPDYWRGTHNEIAMAYWGHPCNTSREPGFVSIHKDPILDQKWERFINLEISRMNSDAENSLLLAWSPQCVDYILTNGGDAFLYHMFDSEQYLGISPIDNILRRTVGNEIPFNWDKYPMMAIRPMVPLDNNISLLRALDLQLNNRVDFSDYARAVAWKLKYKHPIALFTDLYYKHGNINAFVTSNPAVTNYSSIIDQWVFIESKQDRLHPREIIRRDKLYKYQIFPLLKDVTATAFK